MEKKRMKEEYRLQIQLVLVIYVVCFILRIAEYLILRTDQTFWGRIICPQTSRSDVTGSSLAFLRFEFKTDRL